MAAELDGPRLEPRSGAARKLVVFLHGYGADGNDLIEIGRAWQALIPQAAFVSPHAPEPCGQAPIGRQWFALTFRDPNESWVGVNGRRRRSTALLMPNSPVAILPPSALALVGFSQGTMMALHVGLRRATAPLAVVGYSGQLSLPAVADADALAARDQVASAGPARAWRSRRTHPDSRRCFVPRKHWRRWTCRSSGISPRGWGTASTRRGCVTAVNFWPAGSPLRPDLAQPTLRHLHKSRPGFTILSCCTIDGARFAGERRRGAGRERACVAHGLSRPRPQRGLPAAQLLSAVAVVVAGRDQGGFPRAREHRRGIRARGAQPQPGDEAARAWCR